MIYLKLFLVFAKIGVFGFGGGMAMLPMIYQGAQSFGLMSADGVLQSRSHIPGDAWPYGRQCGNLCWI